MATPYALLLLLASQHPAPVAQIKCLYAARSAPRVTPAQRAYASFAAARLLVHHHASSESALEEAKSLLLSAERDLTPSRASGAGSNANYLATLSLLGLVHLLLGDDAAAASAFQSGVRESAAWKDKDVERGEQSDQWQGHFLLFLARVEPNQKKVNDHLQRASVLNIDDPVYRTVLALSQAISAMQRDDTESADKHLMASANELSGALRSSSSSAASSGSTSKHFIESLRAHYYLLYALNAQLSGRTAQLASEGSYPAFEELFKAVDRLDKTSEVAGREFESFFPPLDDVELKQCGEMMYSNVLRMSGDGGARYVAATGTNTSTGNRRNGSNMNHGNHTSVQHLEYEAMRSLAVCDFQQAAKILIHAVNEDQCTGRISGTKAAVGTTIHSKSLPLLIAHYFHSTREYDAAITLLGRSDDTRAAPRAALIELERNDVNSAAARMMALKNAIDVDALPSHERAVVQMVNGLVLLRQDDATGARLLLTKALKQAHGMVGSGQFVGQILNCLAPVQQLRQDHAGALQMLESSATLLKSAKDLMSLVTTLAAMEKLYLAMKQDDKAASCRQYLERKNAELTKRLQLVYSDGAHRELVHLFSR